MKRFIVLMAIIGTLLAIPVTHLRAGNHGSLPQCCVTGRHNNAGRLIHMPPNACNRLRLAEVGCRVFIVDVSGEVCAPVCF